MHRLSKARPIGLAASLVLALLLVFSLAACSSGGGDASDTGDTSSSDGTSPDTAGAEEQSDVVLASTTSTQDSGLFDALVPAFQDAYPLYNMQVIAVGTGEALKLGETKDADVLLVHAKADEEKFVENGYGVERQDVMYNDFVIVGPKSDPAGVNDAADIKDAMTAIAAGSAPFISRGDDSGTHKKELKLWTAAQIATPNPDAQSWYESAGQGMGETLTIASNKGGYTLADRATYLSMKDALDLVILREGDKDLLNQYGVIVVTDAANQEGGQAFFDWILSDEGQRFIEEYGVEEYGQPLFIPNAQ